MFDKLTTPNHSKLDVPGCLMQLCATHMGAELRDIDYQ